MQSQEELSTLHSVCKGCIFATWQNKTQIDCELGRIEKYKQFGDVVDAFDDDNEFYIINNRLCGTRRTKEWVDRLPLDSNLVESVYNEVKIQYDAVIYCNDSSKIVSDGDFVNTINSLVNQSIKPKRIIILVHIGVPSVQTMTNISNIVRPILAGSEIQWEVQQVMEYDADRGRAIDICIRKIKRRYYVVFNAGHIVHENFSKDLDDAVNKEVINFLLLEPLDDGNYQISLPIFHNACGGSNDNKPYVEKTKRIAANNGYDKLVKSVKEVLKCLTTA